MLLCVFVFLLCFHFVFYHVFYYVFISYFLLFVSYKSFRTFIIFPFRIFIMCFIMFSLHFLCVYSIYAWIEAYYPNIRPTSAQISWPNLTQDQGLFHRFEAHKGSEPGSRPSRPSSRELLQLFFPLPPHTRPSCIDRLLFLLSTHMRPFTS